MSNKFMLLRGLTRGNGHWGSFPEILKSKVPNAEIELMEIPGNGTQNHKVTPTEIDSVIQEIKKLSQFVNQAEPFHLVAISLGGIVALKWAELYPKDMASVTIINSSLNQCSPFYKRLNPKNYLKIVIALFEKDFYSREKLILQLTSNNKNKIEQFLKPFSEFSKKHPVLVENFFKQLILANLIQIQGPLPVPVRVINSAQDRLVDFTCSEEIAKLVQAPLSTHPTAGHDLPLDEPEWLSGLVLNFCDELLNSSVKL